jgi:hypothetical protein
MDHDNIFVIKIENNQAINHPLTYSNFLLLFPDCPVEEIPTNETLGQYGYNLFIHTPPPVYGPYVQREDGVWTNTWVSQ